MGIIRIHFLNGPAQINWTRKLSDMSIPLAIIFGVILLIFLSNRILNKTQFLPQTKNTFKRIVAIVIIFIGMFAFIFNLPIALEKQLEIVKFLAVLFSAGIALSSTTVLGNLLSGIMNNAVKRFRNGDLIKIGDLQGRVTSKRFFHTEIQLEDSNFVSVPNLFVATHPVVLTKKSKTVISTTVSLGYDVSRIKIEECLLKAAEAAGLTSPYVYIMDLGDYSVVYKVHGFLEDSSKKYFSTTSQLNAMVLDALHEAKIEIVSPSFMNQQQIDKKLFIPKDHKVQPIEKQESPEELAFADAIKSGEIEKKKDALLKIDKRIKDLREQLKGLVAEEEIEIIKSDLKRCERLKEDFNHNIKEQIKKNEVLE